MSEIELNIEQKKAVIKILLVEAGRLWGQVAANIHETAGMRRLEDPEKYDKNYRHRKELDRVRILKLREAEPLFHSLSKKDKGLLLAEIEKQLASENLDTEGLTPCFETVKSSMEWNDPENLAKTVTHTDVCGVLGRAVREKWTDEKLRSELENFIRSKWGEEGLKGARISVSVAKREVFYAGNGPSFSAHVKEDGSMYTPEDVAGVIEGGMIKKKEGFDN